MRLTVIGCAGSYPGPDSAASCYLLQAEAEDGTTTSIALDLGNGALSRLQHHVGLDQLDAIVLSHLHPDHCMDLCGMYVYRTYHPDVMNGAAARTALPVIAPEGAKERLERAYRTEPAAHAADDDTDFSAAFDFRQLRNREAFRVGPFLIEPFLVDHPVEAYALRVIGPDGAVLTYSGDTDTCPGLVEAARDADVFLCEAAFQEGRDSVRGIHLTGHRAGQIATEAGSRSLRLTHIPAWTDPAAVLAEAAGAYAGPLSAVRVGESIGVGHDRLATG